MANIIDFNEYIKSDKFFRPGDFITFSNKPGAFAIYEGIDVSISSTFKRYTAILSYDPSKYTQTDEGYRMVPSLEVSSKLRNCEKTIDTNESTYWTRKCTKEEVEKALEVMKTYGYEWDYKTLSIVAIGTGDVIAKVHFPKIEYTGQIIKPMTEKFKNMLKMFCINKNKTTAYDSDYYSRYWNYEEYWED
jgi:hypothetical protein